MPAWLEDDDVLAAVVDEALDCFAQAPHRADEAASVAGALGVQAATDRAETATAAIRAARMILEVMDQILISNVRASGTVPTPTFRHTDFV